MNLDFLKVPSLKERYTKLIADKLTISIEDLTESEKAVINESFELFEEKINDLKLANDEVKRLSLELANYKAMYSEKSGRFNDDRYNDNDLRDK